MRYNKNVVYFLDYCKTFVFCGMELSPKDVREQIFEFIQEKGIKFTRIASLLDISRGHLTNVLKMRYDLPAEWLQKINDFLGTSFGQSPEILPHEKLEEDRQSLKDKPLWKDESINNDD